MKKDCTLIATLPNINNPGKVGQMLSCPEITSARFNTGSATLMNANEVISYLREISNIYSKRIWIDLKGRQLRIIKWADPSYETIELNHNIDIVYPAKIYFRNGGFRNIIKTKGNKIIVDQPPQEAVGAGQSVNIIAKELEIEGYLTELDKQFIVEASKVGMDGVFASFVEKIEDLSEIALIMPKAEIVSKIESEKGMELISKVNIGKLMAARDDLYLQTGQNLKMMDHLKTILKSDPNAICASRIFSSVENNDVVDFADYSDLTLMYNMGYRQFMLCDNICNYHFDKAIRAWREFINE